MENSKYYDPADHSYPQPTDRYPSRRNKNITLWMLLVILALSCLWRYFTYRIHVNRDFEIIQGTTETLPNVVNPNTASWASLARLPGIGETKAKAIVAYRDTFYQNNAADHQPFETPDDLTKVKGIGPSIIEKIRPFICCENTLTQRHIDTEKD